MSLYKIAQRAQIFERNNLPQIADIMIESAVAYDMSVKKAQNEVRLLKIARDIQQVTTLPQGNAPGYAGNVRSQLGNTVAGIKALVELHQEVMEQTLGGQGPLYAAFRDAYRTLLKDRKVTEQQAFQQQPGNQFYNQTVYRQGYPHTPGVDSATNVGARAGAAIMGAGVPGGGAAGPSYQQGYARQTGSDIWRGTQQAWQAGKNALRPGSLAPGQQTYIGEAGTSADQSHYDQTRTMGRGRDPLFTGIAMGMDDRIVTPEYSVYWDQ